MATKITDFATTARLWQTIGPIDTDDPAITSDPVDLLEGDGPAFAIVSVGPDVGDATVAASVETSADGLAWESVIGAELAAEGGSGVRAITFTRPKRYLRIVLELADVADPITVSAVLGQSRKIF